MSKTSFLNNICRKMYKKDYKKFVSKRNPGKVQKDILMKYLSDNQDTEFGKKYHFSEIKSYKDYCEKVPLSEYEDYEPYIERMKNGEKNILTKEDVILFELTSGSSGAKKYIPYTQTLKNEFQRGIRPWMHNVYSKTEGVTKGKSYWSITPVTAKKEYTKSGKPIGFEEDAQYFGKIEQHIMKQIFAVDSSKVKFVDSMDRFYHDTAIELLKCKCVTLVSVWNPTFLTILWDFMEANREMLEKESGKTLEDFKNNIRLISCWADGSAKDYVERVKEIFPQANLQPKGILATEAFISFPLVGEDGSRLSIDSHFFEFLDLKTGETCTADELKKGEYEVILTTGGGFYRYRIKDIIEVLETYEDNPPRVRFKRRRGISSDLCGEKLTEEFVRNVIEELNLEKNFCLLAPDKNGYVLYTDNEQITGAEFDMKLREGFHYNYCRQLGQLEETRKVTVSGKPSEKYLERLTSEGMRLGDIKPSYLSKLSGWDKWFG